MENYTVLFVYVAVCEEDISSAMFLYSRENKRATQFQELLR